MLASGRTLSCHCPVKLLAQYQLCIIVCYYKISTEIDFSSKTVAFPYKLLEIQTVVNTAPPYAGSEGESHVSRSQISRFDERSHKSEQEKQFNSLALRAWGGEGAVS